MHCPKYLDAFFLFEYTLNLENFIDFYFTFISAFIYEPVLELERGHLFVLKTLCKFLISENFELAKH